MEGTKQVIVIRKDLNMRKGKIAAQASHASMSFLTRHMAVVSNGFEDHHVSSNLHPDFYWQEVDHWLKNSFKKVCVYVNSEEELLNIHELAKDCGAVSYLITDNGATEFNGVPTKTCLAIGPHWDSKFINLTDHLSLL